MAVVDLPNAAPPAVAAAAATTAPEARRSSEFSTVLMLSVGCGLLGLDRFILGPLFPVMAQDLGLNYQDLGLASGVLALAWGLSSIFTGQLSDRIGRKRVLVPAVVVFSLLVACSGLSAGLLSLLFFRAVMGMAEGAFMPTCIVAAAEASAPRRVGMSIGITQMAVGLVGLGLGPVLATQLLRVVPSWHWVFGIVAVPGLVLAWVMHRRFHDAPRPPVPAEAAGTAPLREVLRQRQVWCLTAASACWFSSLVVLSAFLPTYLTDGLKLPLATMGWVASASGIGAAIGMVGVAALSDRFGRKPVLLLSLALLVVALLALARAPAVPALLFVLVLLVFVFNAGAVAIGIGPLAGHSVPPHLASTATGIVLGAGEVVGGALVPGLTGALAQSQGIAAILTVSTVAAAACLLIVACFVSEPRHAAATSSPPP